MLEESFHYHDIGSRESDIFGTFLVSNPQSNPTALFRLFGIPSDRNVQYKELARVDTDAGDRKGFWRNK